MRLAGATALVTGGSRGIGLATAHELSRRGVRLVLVARPSDALDAAGADVGAVTIPADLTDRASVPAIVEAVRSTVGHVDLLVNNAALVRPEAAARMSAADLEDVMTCNLLAPMLLVRALLPGMLERGRGHIVNVSSGAAALPLAKMSTYCASKAGLLHYTASLRAELWDTPVATTVVELGTVRGTRAYEAALQDRRLRELYGRLQRVGLMRDTPAEEVAERIADAVEAQRPSVRVPRAARVGWALNSCVRDATVRLFCARSSGGR